MTTLMYKSVHELASGCLCHRSRFWVANEIGRTIEMNSAKKPLG